MKKNEDILFKIDDILIRLLYIMFNPIIDLFSSHRKIEKYTICKKNISDNVIKISIPNELKEKYPLEIIEGNIINNIENDIKEFITTIENKFDKNECAIFLKNIKSLKFNFFEEKENIQAYYDSRNNEIYLKEHYSKVSIFHELLHVASSKTKLKSRNTGFEKASKNLFVGIGINEGYTQLLTERYFNNLENVNNIYPYEVSIADMVEEIIGRKTMEKLYMSANLYGLVGELEKYSTMNEIAKFITSLDYVSINYDRIDLTQNEIKQMHESLDCIANYLLVTFLKKLKESIEIKKVSIEESSKMFLEFIKKIGVGYEISGNEYVLSIYNNFQKYLDEIFNNGEYNFKIEYNKDSLHNKCK